jgi:toxin HigB-1
MDVVFLGSDLDRLETDPGFNAGFSREIVRAFRKVMQIIRGAPDKRIYYALKSLHFEKLQGKRAHQRSMRLNRQWRLILQIEPSEFGNQVVIVAIEDYH